MKTVKINYPVFGNYKEVSVTELIEAKAAVRAYVDYLWDETDGCKYDDSLRKEFKKYGGCWSDWADDKTWANEDITKGIVPSDWIERVCNSKG